MKKTRDVEIIKSRTYWVTSGLKNVTGFELSLLIQNQEEAEYLILLNYLINYFIDSKPIIKPEETIAYHSWLLQFVANANNQMNIYEIKNDGSGFIEGADYAIKIINEQNNECINHNVTSLFPTFSQLIVVSKGILEGESINAVRYPSPNHMTGWWLTTDLYNGDIKSLQTIHYYHIAFKRTDIIKYLALPPGFRLYTGGTHEVWFDNDVLL